MAWLFAALLVLLLSAFLALLVQRRPFLSTSIGAGGAFIAAFLGMIPTVPALFGRVTTTFTLPWRTTVGTLAFGMDPLSAFFLAPLLVLGALAAVYGRTYLLPYREHKPLSLPVCFFNLLIATRDMEQLGGLLKRMPKTGVAMVVGAVAIAGLPPLNGFVGEWLIYFGFMGGGLSGGGPSGIAVLLASGLFALVGGLAALCFVRLVGIVLLGEGRSDVSMKAHESSWGMLGPMGFLLAGLFLVAIFPNVVIRAFSGVLEQLLGTPIMVHADSASASLGVLGVIHAMFIGILIAGWVLWTMLSRNSTLRVPTWGCGYSAPTSRMQYTASAFSEMVSVRLFPRWLRALFKVKISGSAFPLEGCFQSECSDPLTRGVYEPFFSRWADRFSHLRWVQQGALHIYILYIFIVAVVALGWISWSTWMAS